MITKEQARANLGEDEASKREALLKVWSERQTASHAFDNHMERVGEEQKAALEALSAEFNEKCDAVFLADVGFATAKAALDIAEQAYSDFDASDLGDILCGGLLRKPHYVTCAASGLVITDNDETVSDAYGNTYLKAALGIPTEVPDESEASAEESA